MVSFFQALLLFNHFYVLTLFLLSVPKTPYFPLITPGTGAKMNDAICQSFASFNAVMTENNMSKSEWSMGSNYWRRTTN